MFSCQGAAYARPMPLDAAVLRENLLDYGVRTLWAILVGALAVLVARAVRRTTIRALARGRAQANVTVLLGNLTQLVVLLVGLLAILAIYTQGAFGWILTTVGALGIVVGLALQDLLKNFFAGVWVLIERPFGIGDTIEVAGHAGVVDQISFRTTQLRTADGRLVIVPNGTLMTEPVVNVTRFPTRRGACWLIVAVDAPAPSPDEVRDALARANSVAHDPAPALELQSVSDGQARYRVTFWAADREGALAAAVGALRERFPNADVHG